MSGIDLRILDDGTVEPLPAVCIVCGRRSFAKVTLRLTVHGHPAKLALPVCGKHTDDVSLDQIEVSKRSTVLEVGSRMPGLIGLGFLIARAIDSSTRGYVVVHDVATEFVDALEDLREREVDDLERKHPGGRERDPDRGRDRDRDFDRDIERIRRKRLAADDGGDEERRPRDEDEDDRRPRRDADDRRPHKDRSLVLGLSIVGGVLVLCAGLGIFMYMSMRSNRWGFVGGPPVVINPGVINLQPQPIVFPPQPFPNQPFPNQPAPVPLPGNPGGQPANPMAPVNPIAPRPIPGADPRTFAGDEIHHVAFVVGLAFSADGKTLYVGCEDRTVWVWDLRTHQRKEQYVLAGVIEQEPLVGMVLSPDGSQLAAIGKRGSLATIDTRTGDQNLAVKHRATSSGSAIHFSSDGKWLLAGRRREVQALDPTTWACQATFAGHSGQVRGLALTKDGTTLASCDPFEVKLWDLTTKKERQTLKHQQAPVRPGEQRNDFLQVLAFSPDGQTLAVGHSSGKLLLWDVATGQERAVLPHDGGVHSVAYSPNGKWLVAGVAGEALMWDAATGKKLRQLPCPDKAPDLRRASGSTLAISPDGNTLAAAGGLVVKLHAVKRLLPDQEKAPPPFPLENQP